MARGGPTGARVAMPGTKGILITPNMPKRLGGYSAGSGVGSEERFASEEARREREFTAQQEAARFRRGSGLIKDFLKGFGGGNITGDINGGSGSDTASGSPSDALEESIRRAGKKRASQVEGILARRGIYKSGASAATAATIQGETEAQVAGARAGLAESAAERKNRRRIAALQARTQLASSAINATSNFL